MALFSLSFSPSILAVCLFMCCALVADSQYYGPPMGGAIGCVVTGTKLFSHGNYIRDLNAEEFQELDKYRRELIDFKEKVDAAYANIDVLMQKNGTLPVIPNRPLMPAFCASNQTTLYILGGCTVQTTMLSHKFNFKLNHKVYIGGKFARDLTEKEKNQLDLFSKQMVAANAAAAQLAAATAGTNNSTNPAAAIPSTTTVSPVTDAGRQIALDFCTEF
uniref:Pepsin inhibitor-3-like repeated domain-containing protein n=1 Tax=Ditylenchus dipsaci TaxID=166011 RepID=A0A915DKQ0_9BILA